MNAYRFQLINTYGPGYGACATSYGETQQEALSGLRSQLCSWEDAVPLHGPAPAGFRRGGFLYR